MVCHTLRTLYLTKLYITFAILKLSNSTYINTENTYYFFF